MTWNRNILFILFLFTNGCQTYSPPPPLTESEIPWRQLPGIYQDTAGIKHIVETNRPRWSVSEAYLHESATEPVQQEKETIEKILDFSKEYSGIGIFSLIIAFLLWKLRKRE